MCWTVRHDEILIREVLLFEPWNQKKGSPERGMIWKRIAESLNSMKEPTFKVDDRSMRDHFKLLEKKYLRKTASEEKASGIAPEGDSEMENGIRDAIEQFRESDILYAKEKEVKGKDVEKELRQGEEFRNQALETFRETRKRLDKDDEVKKKKRRSESETLSYLQQKSKDDFTLKKEELSMKKTEMEERQRNNDRMHEMLMAQQQQNAAILQQQQQVNAALLQVLAKFTSTQ